MSYFPILQTKLFVPPIRPELVSRPRLLERLNRGSRPAQGLGRKLTLVSAPAGFGKTTLVSEWVGHFCLAATNKGQEECAVAWLSLDERDNELTRFLVYLVAALQTIEAGVGQGVLSAVQSPQPPPTEVLLTSLINEITAFPGIPGKRSRMILVLDDYHLIEAQPIHEALTFLLEHLPPQMHLVLVTREDPDLPLARLRVRSQLTELRVADLRFASDEVAEFLNQVMGLDLTAKDIAALETRTEGWIAGLQMAALVLQGIARQGTLSTKGRAATADFIQTFAGSNRFVMDYLAEEVLQRQPDHVRSFLLQTSILDRLCGSLCDAVRFGGDAETPNGQEDGKGMLEALERGNLFVVPLDDKRQWYRYHHLFADVLQAHLREEQPDQVSTLHRRASEWWEQMGSPADAVRHALAAEDLRRAARLIELAWTAMDRSYQSATWLGWVKALPEEMIRTRPVLSVGYAWALLDGGEMEAVEARLEDAERWLSPLGSGTRPAQAPRGEKMVVADRVQFRSLPASIAAARAYQAQALGDIPATIRYARRALELAPEDDHLRHIQANALLGLTYWASGDLDAASRSFADVISRMQTAGNIADAIGTTYVVAEIKMALGRLDEAARMYEQSFQLAAEQGGPMPQGMADLYRGMSELRLEQGDLEAATQHLLTAEKLGEQAELPGWQSRLRIAQARMKQTRGDLDGALDLLDEAERLRIRTPLPDVHPVAAWKARIWLAQGKLAQALDWVREQGLSVADDLSYLREFEHITLARVLSARYKSEQVADSIYEALGLLDRLLQAAEEGGRMGSAIEVLVLQALAHQACGDVSAALVPLRRALLLAEPEGYVQVFVDEGPDMATLLREAAKEGVALGYVGQLQTALGQGQPFGTQPLIEPLSGRELEVLGLLRTELSGPEIARELVVSLNTMRTHTKNIYSKLGVNNRRAAVRRAEELGLL